MRESPPRSGEATGLSALPSHRPDGGIAGASTRADGEKGMSAALVRSESAGPPLG